MNEPKKRGRPGKADVVAREAKPEGGDVTHNGDTSGQLERVQVESAQASNSLTSMSIGESVFAIRAQAYAMMVWAGQSADLGRAERIARCERALTAQNLPTEDVKYPGAQDAEDWTDDDEKPVTWRKAGA